MFRFAFAVVAAALVSHFAYAADVERPASLDASQGQYAVVAPVFTGADNNTSFLRLFYVPGDSTTAPATAKFAVKVVGSPSGNVYGTASVDVSSYASPQYSLSQLLTQAGVSGLASGDSAYALYVDGGVDGTGYAHVIYNGANGFFENASACEAYVQALPGARKYLFNVHTSRLSGYPSQITVHNYASTALTYQAAVYDARNGTKIGTLTKQAAANSTTSIAFSTIEQQLGWTPDSSQLHANIVFDVDGADTVPLVVAAFITNQALNTAVNMTSICQAHGFVSTGTGGTGASSYTLTVTKIGAGAGTITSSPLPTINCGSTCTGTFTKGTITLTPAAAAGSSFLGWSGCTSTSGNLCTVDLDSDKIVTATFGVYTLTVSKIGTGSGSVTSSAGNIDCGSVCATGASEGQQISLTATPAAGSGFQNWSGCTSTSGATGNICNVTVTANKTVTVTFGASPTLAVTKLGSGTVTSSTGGINCGSTCSTQIADGQIVTLTATPASGLNVDFLGWSGCTSTSGVICSVTMSGNKTVTATFK